MGYVPDESVSTASTRILIVACGEFASLVRRRGWTLDFLTERFRGQIADTHGRWPTRTREFFTYVMQGRYAKTLIPFRSVIRFYAQERGLEPVGAKRTCACGCLLPVFDRRKWASAACRKRAQRRQSATREIQPKSA